MLKLSNLETIGRPVYNFHNLHSVDFDGVDDFIQLGEPISYTQHTISTWVKVSDSDASKTIIDARDANDDGIRIFLTSAEVVTYQLNTSDITSGSAISVDEWHHIVGTYDGTTQKLYIDGSLVSSATTSQTISTTTNAKIGSRNFSDRANEFAGKIDELAIFDRALTADEVTAIFRIKYGANLVQNGNFDELGSELVTNGDFSNGLTGFVTENVELAEGGVRIQSDGSSGSFIKQSGILTLNKTYKLVFDVTQVQQTGSLRVGFSSLGVSNITTTGTYTIYFVANGSEFQFVRNSAINVIVDNVSVKQVDPNDRFTLGTGWSYGDGVAVHTGTQSLLQQNGIFTIGKTYKISFILSNADSSNYVRLLTSHYPNGGNFTTNGFTSIITTANITQLYIYGVGDVTLDNVMVEEQKYVATNLKLKSTLFNPFTGSTLNLKNYYRFGDGILDTHPLICDMVEPSLGSEQIANGTFDRDTNWGKTNAVIENGVATITIPEGGAYSAITQSNSNMNSPFISGKAYKLTATINGTSGKLIRFQDNSSNTGGLTVANGTFTLTGLSQEVKIFWLANSNSNMITIVRSTSEAYVFTVDNVSVKQVNGVPGFMTNMTEADITNDVPG